MAAIVLFLMFQIGLILVGVAHEEKCHLRRCGDNGPDIHFPFWLKADKPNGCGYGPGFNLTCSPTNETLLHLPFSVTVSVNEINYTEQVINITNPTRCYPNNLNLSTSPFRFLRHFVHDYSLFSCPTTPLRYLGEQVTCLGTPGHIVYAIPSDSVIRKSPLLSCTKMHNIPSVPSGIFDQLRYSLLSWSKPSCRYYCEVKGTYFISQILYGNSTEHEYDVLCPLKDATKYAHVMEGLAIALIPLAISISYCICHLSNKLENDEKAKIERFLEDYKALKPTRYKYADIKKITDKFNDRLGQGGYGTVYKGKLSNDVFIAAKILNNFTGDGDDFLNEVGTIGSIHHVNVVRLVGYCADGYKKALVYEYQPNDSLEKFISSDRRKKSWLGWVKMNDIALGIARGIEYLHQGCDQRILHFDIKPHNILLDKNFNPKISDFGLAKLCPKEQSAVSITAARGTVGYIAPEVFSRNFGNVSHKSDVYSFGMLLLEMVGGRKNTDVAAQSEDQVYFPEWIYKRLNRDEENGSEIEEEGDAKIVRKLTVVGLWCIQWWPGDRPSMKVVVQMLEGDGQTLAMPPNPFSTTNIPSTDRVNMGGRSFSSMLEVISESD